MGSARKRLDGPDSERWLSEALAGGAASGVECKAEASVVGFAAEQDWVGELCELGVHPLQFFTTARGPASNDVLLSPSAFSGDAEGEVCFEEVVSLFSVLADSDRALVTTACDVAE